MRHSIYSRLGLVPLFFNDKALYMINALLTNDKAAEGVSGNPFPTPPRHHEESQQKDENL